MPARMILSAWLIALLSACAALPAAMPNPTEAPQSGVAPAAPTSTLAPAPPLANPELPAETLTRISWGGLTGAAALHPDGTMLAIGTDDGARVVQLPDGTDLGFFAFDAAAAELAWDAEGRFLVVLSDDGRAVTFDVEGGGTMRTLAQSYVVVPSGNRSGVTRQPPRLSPDGSALAVPGAPATVLRMPDGAVIATAPPEYGQRSVEWLQDGRRLRLGGGGDALLWDAERGTVGPFDEALSGEVVSQDTITRDRSPDGRWSATAMMEAQGLTAGSELRAMTWSPDSQYLASSGWDARGVVFVRRASDGAIVARFADPLDTSLDLAGIDNVPQQYYYNPVDQLLWSAATDTLVVVKPAQDLVRLWDVRTGQIRGTITGFLRFTETAWSPDRQLLATVNARSTLHSAGVHIWRRDGTLLRVLDEHRAAPDWIRLYLEPYGVTWSPDGRRLAVRSYLAYNVFSPPMPRHTDKISIWDITTSPPSMTMSRVEVLPRTHCAAYSRDGIIAVPQEGALIQLFRDSDGEALTPLQGHTGEVQCVGFSPDGSTLASISADGTIVLWEWPAQRVRLSIPAGGTLVCVCIAWSSDGSMVASVVDEELVVWRASDGAVHQRMPLPGPVTEIVWSPDGQYLLTCDSHGNLHILRASDGVVVRTIKGPRAALTWSADGTTLVGSDGTTLRAVSLDGQLPAPAAAGAEPPRGLELPLPTPTVAPTAVDPNWITVPAGGGVGSFRIMRTEVTQADYVRCMNAGACSAPEVSAFRSHYPAEWQPYWYSRINDTYFNNHPIVWVSQQQAREYARWIGGRLPTEAEWQRAAQGDDGRTYPWGDAGLDGTRSNFRGITGDMQVVGSYPAGASPYGVLDMSGNVWEWVAEGGILRGGSFMEPAEYVRATTRLDCAVRGCVLYDVGFRVVLDGTGGIGGAAPAPAARPRG